MRRMPLAAAGLLLLVLGRSSALCADAPQPEDVVRKMCDFYKGQKSFSVNSDTNVEVHGKNSSKSGFRAVFERPDHLALKGEGGTGLSVVSDGDTLYVAARNRYMKTDAPDSLNEVAENALLASGIPGGTNFVVDFATDDPAKLILKDVTASQDLGVTKLNGHPARHLKFTCRRVDWEAWIADEGDPLLLQVSYDLSKTVRMKGKTPKSGSVVSTQTFNEWKFGITPSPQEFTFTPTKDAKESHRLIRLRGQTEAPSPLLGKAAPVVDLARLDGKRVKLADHSGKDVVMLDMWATWCGPCRAELPHLVQVAKDYKGQGVVFYAIDLRDTKDKVKEFLKKEKLDMTVGLDSHGAVGEAYGADAIPMLMLIDKKGVVQVVHIGNRPGVEEVLHKELDSILAGKDLAAATIADFDAKKKAADAARAKRRQEREKAKKASPEQTAR
jgi:peroxiredoxin